MNINMIVKNAAHDRNLRLNLLADPIDTCKKYGIDVRRFVSDVAKIDTVKDNSIMQGGYRP
jgi:hypothetical protein